MDILDQFRAALGSNYVLTGKDMAPWVSDWAGQYSSDPLAVLRPENTDQVAAAIKIANLAQLPVTPVSGNTGLNGGATTQNGVLLSLDRLNTIDDMDVDSRTVKVGAGVILANLHDAADERGLIFPLTFGARGSAMIGGVLSTNAGGSNVLRYGNTRDLVLGIEAVMADGTVMNLMGALHKDNSGYNLKHLLIGAEGTLGIITRAVVKLFPKPADYATAFAAVRDLPTALQLLNRLQSVTSGNVEAFEYMPADYLERYFAMHPSAKRPFAKTHPVNLLIEVGASEAVNEHLTSILAAMMETGDVIEASIAQSDSQRAAFWAIREAAAEVSFAQKPFIDTDLAVALRDVGPFLDQITPRVLALDPEATDLAIAHLGDGNIHYTVYPSRDDATLKMAIRAEVAALTTQMSGSFSAEHGVGLSKRATMAAHKDPAALAAMRAIKAALDPKGILNPGKVIPD